MGKKARQEAVHVFTRLRPLDGARDGPSSFNAVVADLERSVVDCMDERGQISRSYRFQGVFSPDASQESVYAQCGRPLVDSVFDGFNAGGSAAVVAGACAGVFRPSAAHHARQRSSATGKLARGRRIR